MDGSILKLRELTRYALLLNVYFPYRVIFDQTYIYCTNFYTSISCKKSIFLYEANINVYRFLCIKIVGICIYLCINLLKLYFYTISLYVYTCIIESLNTVFFLFFFFLNIKSGRTMCSKPIQHAFFTSF